MKVGVDDWPRNEKKNLVTVANINSSSSVVAFGNQQRLQKYIGGYRQKQEKPRVVSNANKGIFPSAVSSIN